MSVDDADSIIVLGTGNMGHGIAEVATLAGYDAVLHDIEGELVQQGYGKIEWSLGKLVEKDRLSQDDTDAMLARVSATVDLGEAVVNADVVAEAVPEKMAIKKEVYAELEEYAPDHAVFVTNTSSLSITEPSEVTERPERFCEMHFFSPPVRMDLVEVIPGAYAADETFDPAEDLAESMGKTSVRVRKDSPDFTVNRILVPLMNEAAWIVHVGDATMVEVDATTKYDTGLPMGSFELIDYVGIGVGYRVLKYMREVFGDAYEPCPFLSEKVEEGDLSQETGAGFYDYEDGAGAEIPHDEGSEAVKNRLLGVMANEVAGLVGNDMADPTAIDRAIKPGGRFPDSPAGMADSAGIAALVDTLDELHDKTGEARYETMECLRDLAQSGEGFYGNGGESESGDAPASDAIVVEVRDGVGHITLDWPHRLNTIDVELMDELSEATDLCADDDEVRTVLLARAGDRAFSAGADVTSIAADGGDSVEGAEVSRKGQQTFGKLEELDKPVVVGIDDSCLGGGMELAMCTNPRIAMGRSELGQPEHDLGLLPGWGGTVRLQRTVGIGRTKEITFSADRYGAEMMVSYGFVNKVVENDDDFEERVFEYAKRFAQGPPVAQRYTKRAMHNGREDTDSRLEVEAQAFGLLFTTSDLMEGVAAFTSDRDPEFTGG